MKIFSGRVRRKDIETAISNARKINPDIKKIYVGLQDPNRLKFAIMNNIQVHSIECSPYDIFDESEIREGKNKTPENVPKGFQACLSIPLYEKFVTDNSIISIGIERYGDYDKSIACTL
jgi:hypothetical protein